MPTPQQTAAQMAAALNPEAKSFSPVIPQQGGTSRSSTSNNSGSNSAATAPLPAGEASGGNTNGGTPNQPQGGGGGRGGFGGVAGAYVPPARQGGGNVGPPLHPQNQNPTLYNNQQQGSVNGHGNASFLPSHSGGSGGGRFSGGGHGGGNFGNNNNSGGNFGGNNNNNNFPHHHHHHHGGPGGNFGGHHHHHHHNQGGNMGGGGGPHNQHQHHHQHQYHHHHHMHHQSHQHNNNNMPPNQGGNFGNNNQGGGPGGNFAPHHHHHHQHYNQHHHHNNNMNNNNNNFPHHHQHQHQHHHNQMNNSNTNFNNNNNNNNNNGHPQNIPHPARGGRGRGMMNNNNPANNNRNREPRKAVVVLGAPKSGKTTLAKRIAKEFNNFHYIEAPLDKEKFETLSDELKALVQGEGAPGNNYNHDKMLVLDGFGADHDADLFYLGSVLKRYNFNVYGLVYLNLDKPAETISRRQERVPPSTAQMFGHAVAFETCAMYDSSPNLILVDADMNQDDVFDKFKEMWQDAQMVPLEVVAPRVLRCIDKSSSWKMETYGEFKIVTSALEKALPSSAMTSGSSPMPLRSPYGPLAYQHFSRMFSRLPKYNVSLMTNGQRVVLFAFNGYLYFLPEHGYYVFRYEPAGTPHHACRVTNWFDDLALKCEKPEGTCPLVLDAEYVIFQGDDYILLRDILVYGSEPCYNLPLSERIEKMASCMKNRAGDENNISIQVLPHRYANVENVKEIFSVWERAEETGEDSPPAQGTPNAATKVGVGVRLEPPGEYPVGQHDPSLLYWFEPDRIAIIARLWNVEDLGDDGQRFTVMAVDDSSGLEVKLPRDCPEKVTIPRDTITDEQLGEGHIVELILHKRLAPVPPASRGGRNQNRSQPSEILEFRFERRRWDIAVPMYHSTVSAIIHQVRHSWTREYFTKTCELVQSIQQQNSLSGNDSGASTPMTPSSPSMN